MTSSVVCQLYSCIYCHFLAETEKLDQLDYGRNLLCFFKKDSFLFYVYECLAYMNVSASHVCSVFRGQKIALDPPGSGIGQLGAAM